MQDDVRYDDFFDGPSKEDKNKNIPLKSSHNKCDEIEDNDESSAAEDDKMESSIAEETEVKPINCFLTFPLNALLMNFKV